MLLGAPEPKSQAHLPKWHVVQHKTHFWDHHSQTQPLEQPWALPESRTPEAEQPHFIPSPQAPLPKLVVTSGGIGGRGGVSPSAGAKQKLMQSRCPMQDLHLSCHTRHCRNGLEHQHRAKHQISPVLRRAWKNLGRQSRGIDAPIPPPHRKQREELAWAVLLGNEAQLPSAPSPCFCCSPCPLPDSHQGMGGLYLWKLWINISTFPWLEMEGRGCPCPGTAPTPLQLSSLVLNKPAGERRDSISHYSPCGHLFTQCHIPALNTHQCAWGRQPRSIFAL